MDFQPPVEPPAPGASISPTEGLAMLGQQKMIPLLPGVPQAGAPGLPLGALPGSNTGAPAVPGVGFPLMQLPIQILNDPKILSQVTGFPLQTLQANPGMMAAAQQLFAQRLFQQQLLNSGQLVRPGTVPANLQQFQQIQAMQVASMVAQQQQQQQQQRQQLQAQQGKPAGKGKSSKAAGTKQAKHVQPPIPLVKEDPGGKIIWAKMANYPWWPAKTLDPTTDRSFPRDADPPRPTAIPVRFFGTHEFVWMGSKRAVTDWEEGLEQFSKECDHDSFKAAIEEAEEYRKSNTLPDVFYMLPEPESGKKGSKSKKRGSNTLAARKSSAADDVTTPAGSRPKSGRAMPFGSPEDRVAVMQNRKKERLLDLGLVPPAESPYSSGRVAPNPALLQLASAWGIPETMAAAAQDAGAKQECLHRALIQRKIENPARVDLANTTIVENAPVENAQKMISEQL